MDDIGGKITGIIAAIISLAVLAVVVSQGANTASVIGSFFSGVTSLLAVAISPVTNSGAASNVLQNLGGGLTGSYIGSNISGYSNGVNGSVSLGSSGNTAGGILAGTGVALNGAASLTNALGGAGGISSLFGGSGSAVLGNTGSWDTLS
jgi:hypothetical protein